MPPSPCLRNTSPPSRSRSLRKRDRWSRRKINPPLEICAPAPPQPELTSSCTPSTSSDRAEQAARPIALASGPQGPIGPGSEPIGPGSEPIGSVTRTDHGNRFSGGQWRICVDSVLLSVTRKQRRRVVDTKTLGSDTASRSRSPRGGPCCSKPDCSLQTRRGERARALADSDLPVGSLEPPHSS